MLELLCHAVQREIGQNTQRDKRAENEEKEYTASDNASEGFKF
jgi:hypothetical protein